jgi:hypothetical protein
MWCFGNTCVVRTGDGVFASGLETISGAKPLNNCRPLLFARSASGWQRVFDGQGRTREPCPLATLRDDHVYLSINPTLTEPDTYNGPAQPQVLAFSAAEPSQAPQAMMPTWDGEPRFTEHSYRSFAADGENGELILFQNIGYTHAEWTFRDADGAWSAQGRLVWPWGSEYDEPQPIRVCYPAVALTNRRVYFCGVSDIVEPYKRFREYKKQLTGREWDYDFRRLFFTFSDDIHSGKFHDWVEISSRDRTCGWIFPNDLFVAASGDVFLLWNERAIDDRLREEFFPGEKQRHSLYCAKVRDGKVVRRVALVEGGEGLGALMPGRGRFQVTDDGRLFVFYHVGGQGDDGRAVSENRVVEVLPDGRLGEPVAVHLKQPLSAFFTATVRAGCRPSNIVDVFGPIGQTMRYARIRLW